MLSLFESEQFRKKIHHVVERVRPRRQRHFGPANVAQNTYKLVSSLLLAGALNPPSQFETTVKVTEASRGEIQ